jgi:succinate-acetate transporter protein
MQNANVPVALKDITANPAPLGLLGFGMTTVLLNLHNAGLYPNGSMIFAMGIFCGGLAQLIAGKMEWKKGNTFGTTAFSMYGIFWLSLVAIWVLPKLGWAEANSVSAISWYLFVWGLFTLVMFFGTLKANRALQFVFLSLTILFFLLALGDAFESPTLKMIAGIEGIICGLSAVYTGLAQVVNEANGRIIMPLGQMK